MRRWRLLIIFSGGVIRPFQLGPLTLALTVWSSTGAGNGSSELNARVDKCGGHVFDGETGGLDCPSNGVVQA
ncbi:hypothetical protein V6N11_040992 [Hibiscus sabdariffa]|uniref:Uncharacterized protein n=1 Tax=Hibiscus sabdariffa TaxID=183260 RepID=A0ABR2RJH4_9ROSI